MPRLVPVEIGEAAYLEAIIDGKKAPVRSRLLALKPRLKARYADYSSATGAFGQLAASTLAGAEIADCVACYNLDRVPVAKLKQAVLAARPKHRDYLCQWCLIDSWSDLDHYVPRESFPEFSVMARNLVPCCSKCNKAKMNYWPPVGNAPEVLSLYYSSLLDRPHLAATVSHTRGQPTEIRFSIRTSAGLTHTEITSLQAHYSRLKLIPRLRDAGLYALSSFREALRARAFSRSEAASFLRTEAAAKSVTDGPNHPWALTAVALARCSNALDEYLT